MRDMSRRSLLGAGIGAAAAIGIAGCGTDSGTPGNAGKDSGGAGDQTKPSAKPSEKSVRPIGDGSTADTGKQPHQPPGPVPLEPGETPPQFVIFSWDGAGRWATASSPASSTSPRTTARR